jgi:hypothetical protein
MGVLESNTTLIYGVHIRESANDGSDFTNAAADYRIAFIGEDGLWHVKDSSGTVSEPFTAGGGGVDSGTSFPGSPANNDIFYRTDRDILYFYDGTRWLTVNLFTDQVGFWSNVSAGTTAQSPVWTDAYDQYLVDFRAVMYTSSGSSGSAYWRIDLYTPDGTTLGSTVASVNNASATNASYDRKTASIGALLGTGKDGFVADLVKVTTPGTFYGGCMVTYRLVG